MDSVIQTHVLAALSFLCAITGCGAPTAAKPNILWISLEDITPMMGCYGDEYARTPVFDRLAAIGSPVSMGPVFNNGESMARRERTHGLEVDRVAP